MTNLKRHFVFTALIGLGFALAITQSAEAQRQGFGGDSGIRLLRNQKVQEELELVEDQIQKIDEMQAEQQDEMRKMFTGMRERFRDLDRDGRREAMDKVREEMSTLNEKYVGRVSEILLPHQTTRWEQLRFQSQAQQAGGADRFLGSDAIAKKLNITDEQMEAMKAKAAEIRDSVQEKIAKIRAEAQEKLLSVLTPEQQEQYKSLVGESFAFDENQRQGGGWNRDRGGRGNRSSRGDRGPRGDRGGRPNRGPDSTEAVAN